MNFKRIRSLWTDKTQNEEGIAAPETNSEARFRTWVLGIAFLVGPPLLLLFYYKTMFPGLVNAEAIDFAQVGRNLAEGRGFSTYFIRPLALTPGANPLHLPDVNHGPLFPLILAIAMGILGTKDNTIAIVSGLFYLLTIPVLYMLGVKMFDRRVALLAVIIYVLNALMLEYAISGLHITLYLFLMTSLLLVICNMALRVESSEALREAPGRQYMWAGLLTGLLYLTDPIFMGIVPFVLGIMVWLSPGRRVRGGALFLSAFCAVSLPWMLRNALVAGNPLFGLRYMDVWMDTKGHYPDYTVYRVFRQDLEPGIGLFRAVVQKLLLSIGGIIQSFPQITASWILAFFLPCLLFRFTSPAANTVRRAMMYCFFGVLLITLLFHIQMQLFVSVIPTMLVFSVAYLMHLFGQAQLSRVSMTFATVLLTIAVSFPLLSTMLLQPKPAVIQDKEAALLLGKFTHPSDIVLSDQPWLVAWYADRPAIWIPLNESRVKDVRKQYSGTKWMFLTDNVRAFSPSWQYLYDGLEQWNETCVRANTTSAQAPASIRIAGNGNPLYEALSGFVSVAPTHGSAPATVIATLLPPGTGVQPQADKPVIGGRRASNTTMAAK